MSNQKSHHLRNEYPLCKITVRMIPAAQEVHSTLGPGCMEIFYQRALALELPAHDLDFSREVRIDVFNTGQNPGEKREDFIIECAMVKKSQSCIGRCGFYPGIILLEGFWLSGRTAI